MPELNAETLEDLQQKWKIVSSGILDQADESLRTQREIVKALEELGLDPDVDETYELLDPDLTKQDFDQQHTYLLMISVLEGYHQMQQQRHDMLGVRASRHFYGLEQLMTYTLPMFEESLANAGLPEESDLSPLMLREIEFIRQMHSEGVLEEELKRAALAAAEEHMRFAHAKFEQAHEDRNEGYIYRICKEGLTAAGLTAERIGRAGEFYEPRQIPAKYDCFGGWEEGTIEFSREKAADYQEFFLLRELQDVYETALEFQAEGHFVIDTSGGGFGANILPLQEILGRLQDYGYDITQPETFAKIGTDRETFRAHYRRERDAVSADESFSSLIKPAFTL